MKARTSISKRLSRTSITKALDADFGCQYSESKLKRIRNYQEETPLWQIITTCCLLLEPIVMIVPFLLLPFEGIANGLSGTNWFQILLFINGTTYSGIMLVLRHQKIVPIALEKWQYVFAAAMMPICSSLAVIFIELNFIYPVPFSSVVLGASGMPPVYLSLLLYFDS